MAHLFSDKSDAIYRNNFPKMKFNQLKRNTHIDTLVQEHGASASRFSLNGCKLVFGLSVSLIAAN